MAGGEDLRETLDQGEFVLDLAAIGLGLLLCFVEFVGGGVFFQSDLCEILVRAPSIEQLGNRTLKRGMLWVGVEEK